MREIFFRNVGFAGISMVVDQLAALGVLLYAARILEPKAFGVYALVSIMIVFGTLISEFGGGAYLIHRKEKNSLVTNTVFSFNFLLCIALCAFIIAISRLLSDYFSLVDDAPVTLATLVIFFQCIGGLYKAALQRDLLFRSISIIEISSALTGFVISLVLLNKGYGIFALISFPLVRSFMQLILCKTASRVKFALRIDRNEVIRIFQFSSYLTVNSTVNQVSRSADQLIIAKTISDVALGYYSLAHKVMLFPVLQITAVISRVMYPTLVHQKDEFVRFKESFLKITVTVSLIIFPMMSFIFFNSKELVSLFLGERWDTVAEILKILAPIGAIQSIMASVGPVFLIFGKTKLSMEIQLAYTFLTVCAFLVGVQWGLLGVCYAYLVSNVVLFIPMYKKAVDLVYLPITRILNLIFQVAIASVLLAFGMRFICLNIASDEGLFVALNCVLMVFSFAFLYFSGGYEHLLRRFCGVDSI